MAKSTRLAVWQPTFAICKCVVDEEEHFTGAAVFQFPHPAASASVGLEAIYGNWDTLVAKATRKVV